MDTFVKIINLEGLQGLYVGFYAFYLKNYIYGMLTIHLMDMFENKWKKDAGLPKHFW